MHDQHDASSGRTAQTRTHGQRKRPYLLLTVMTVLSFAAMYVLMYAMVNELGNVYTNRNELYMAALMTAPMVLIEMIVMRAMYPLAKWNVAIAGGAVIVGILSFYAIRRQTGIDDKEFLRSMIPHHAGAILMCGQAHLESPDIRKLCEQIISGQREEIQTMKSMLEARR